MFKWIKRIVILLILLAIVAFFAIDKSMNSLVKSGIEKGGYQSDRRTRHLAGCLIGDAVGSRLPVWPANRQS